MTTPPAIRLLRIRDLARRADQQHRKIEPREILALLDGDRA